MSNAAVVFKRLGQVLLVIVLVLAAIWAYGRMAFPTAEQQAALTVMQVPSKASLAQGENGFVLANALQGTSFDARCPDVGDCLDEVSRYIAEHPDWRAVDGEAMAAAERVLRAPRFVDERSAADFNEQLPPFRSFTVLHGWRAAVFLSGEQAEAVGAVCQDALDFRRWLMAPDNLLQAMIADAGFGLSARTLAEMRAAAPELPLPAACAPLLESPDPAQEGMACEALKGEWRFANRFLASTDVGNGIQWWGMTPEYLQARSAENLVQACGADAEAAARADQSVSWQAFHTRDVDRIAFPVGVVLAEIASPAFHRYPDRYLDHVVRRRALAAALQMAAMDTVLPVTERFAALPAALRDGARALRLSANGQHIEFDLRDTSSNRPTVWQLRVH